MKMMEMHESRAARLLGIHRGEQVGRAVHRHDERFGTESLGAQNKLVPGFTADYNVNRLVWFEEFREVRDAIEMEKRIKGWRRSKKIALIERLNPRGRDLSEGWYDGVLAADSRRRPETGEGDSSQARNDTMAEKA